MYTNRNIWNVSYPIFLSLLAQNVINVTDTAFLGRVGEVELGASAMGGLYYICAFTIAFGFSTGSQIVIGRRNGEGRYDPYKGVDIERCLDGNDECLTGLSFDFRTCRIPKDGYSRGGYRFRHSRGGIDSLFRGLHETYRRYT